MTEVADKIRQKVYEKFDRRCARCGSAYMLHVHHIIHKSVADKDTMNDEENLILLCHNCHMAHHNGGYAIKAENVDGKIRYRFSDSFLFGDKDEPKT